MAGYADDICIMDRRKGAMKQAYEELKRAARGRLIFNVNKTKIMITSRRDAHIEEEMKTGVDTIEVVYEFVYRGTSITKHRDERYDIRRTGLANNAYYLLLPLMKSRDVHKQKKIELCKTLTRSVLWYCSEAWTLSQTAGKMLNASERKVQRKNVRTGVG
jgi:hypothetical protein